MNTHVETVNADVVTSGLTVREWVALDPGSVQQWTRRITGWFWQRNFRLRVVGLENMPATGAALLCPNHSTWFDGVLYALPVLRPLRWMGKREAVKWPLLGRYVRAGGVFPVARGANDTAAIEIALRVLADGQLLFVYPEGTHRHGKPGLGTPKSGPARLALATGVAVIPIASYGMKRADYPRGKGRWWRRHVVVVYGEPMSFARVEPTPENVAPARERIWQRVLELHQQAEQLHAEHRRSGRT